MRPYFAVCRELCCEQKCLVSLKTCLVALSLCLDAVPGETATASRTFKSVLGEPSILIKAIFRGTVPGAVPGGTGWLEKPVP